MLMSFCSLRMENAAQPDALRWPFWIMGSLKEPMLFKQDF